MNCVCNGTFGHGVWMYALVCMDMDSLLLIKKNIDKNKLYCVINMSNDRVQTKRSS
jgi:hypothetical protein